MAKKVSQEVLGIISYTTWPIPPMPFRLCVVGQADYAGNLFQNGTQVKGIPVQARRMAISDTLLGASCDVVYEGALSSTERGFVQASIAGHPVLTIAEHDELCSDSSMFCIAVRGPEVAFAVNLDSIARSGLTIDPNVLLLARPARPQQ